MMVGVITTDTKIGILNFAILFGHVIFTQLANDLFLELLILGLINSKVDNINRQALFYGLIDDIILLEFLGDIIFVV
jgi:hypothetical protein